MRRNILLSLLALLFVSVFLQARPADQSWIVISNNYANQLFAVLMKHHPDRGSREGLSQYDPLISQPTRADEDLERRETAEVLAKLKAAAAQQQQKEVVQDLQIMIRAVELQFRAEDFARAHEVPFINASSYVFAGLHILLDEQTAADRSPAAVVRLRKYAGIEPGYAPIVEILKQRAIEQMAKPGVVYPARVEIETELSRNSNYTEGISALMTKYKLDGWQEPFGKLKSQVADYDAWIRTNILPKARSDFRLPPEEYALNLEQYGIDIPPAQIAAMAHQAFTEIQGEMQPIAARIAKERNLPSNDYRDVIHELKKQQLVGDAILPFYENRLKQIEQIIVAQKIVTLPDRPARIRIATAAETAQQPAPHMVAPPFLHNTGQKGEFVLPLNIPGPAGESATDNYDDFTYHAAAWPLTAHEARPRHERQI